MARSIDVTLELDNRQYQRAIKQSQAQTDKFANESKSAIGGVAAAFAALGAGSVIGSIVKVGSTFQDLQNSLNVVFGSVDEGAKQFQRVQEFAQGTQFSVQTLTQAFVQLKGAGVEPTDELLQTFADTASVTTDQMGTFQAALDLVSRSTAGGLGLEDLNRLADRGIPVFQMLQDKLGLTRLEISEFGKTAGGAKQIVEALTESLQERFGGALEDSANNISRLTNNLGDSLDSLQKALFDLFSEDLAEGIKGLTGIINDLTTAINGFNEAGVDTKKILGGLGAAVLFLINPFQKIGLLFKGLRALFSPFTKAAGGLVKVFKQLKDNTTNFLAQFSVSLKKVFGSKQAKEILDNSNALKDYSGAIKGVAATIFNSIAAFFGYKAIVGETGDESEDAADQIDGMTGAMKRNSEAQAEFEARQEAARIAAEKAKEEYKAILKPFEEYIKLAQEFSKNDYRSEQEKINDRVAQAREVLDQVREAFIATGRAVEEYDAFLKENNISLDQMIAELADAVFAQAAFAQKVEEGENKLSDYEKFLVKLLEDTKAYSDQQKFAAKAMEFLNSQLAQGAMTAEELAYAVERLNSILGITPDKVPTEAFEAFKDIVDASTGVFANHEVLMAELNRLYAEGKINAEQYAEAQTYLNEKLSENEGLNNFLDTLGRAQVQLSQDLAQAFMDGESAGDSFQKFFKKMVKQIIADILRLAVIQPILAAILGPFGYGFGAGGSVIKLPGKANGGPVTAGGAYVVGERGPEILQMGSQSGNIVPNHMLGGGAVTYNINAVDAKSFKQLVASDPEFIFSVTQAGARRIPG